jgi:HEPN domain-containing protein/predicted nucleotidyltransferase
MLARPGTPMYSRRMLPVAADPFLASATRTIVDRFAPERLVLFGSRARGDHHPESDYDLIVVVDTPLDRGERDRPIREALPAGAHRVDLIVYTPQEFEISRGDVGALAFAAEAEGVVLYERNPSRWRRRVREKPRGTPPSFANWIARAESDFAAMTTLFAGSRSLDAVVLHAHQSAEKFLKAALVASHVMPPRSHSLSQLLARSAPAHREDSRLISACALLDGLWPKTRYPDAALPTVSEAEAAIAAAADIRAAVGRS